MKLSFGSSKSQEVFSSMFSIFSFKTWNKMTPEPHESISEQWGKELSCLPVQTLHSNTIQAPELKIWTLTKDLEWRSDSYARHLHHQLFLRALLVWKVVLRKQTLQLLVSKVSNEIKSINLASIRATATWKEQQEPTYVLMQRHARRWSDAWVNKLPGLQNEWMKRTNQRKKATRSRPFCEMHMTTEISAVLFLKPLENKGQQENPKWINIIPWPIPEYVCPHRSFINAITSSVKPNGHLNW